MKHSIIVALAAKKVVEKSLITNQYIFEKMLLFKELKHLIAIMAIQKKSRKRLIANQYVFGILLSLQKVEIFNFHGLGAKRWKRPPIGMNLEYALYTLI